MNRAHAGQEPHHCYNCASASYVSERGNGEGVEADAIPSGGWWGKSEQEGEKQVAQHLAEDPTCVRRRDLQVYWQQYISFLYQSQGMIHAPSFLLPALRGSSICGCHWWRQQALCGSSHGSPAWGWHWMMNFSAMGIDKFIYFILHTTPNYCHVPSVAHAIGRYGNCRGVRYGDKERGLNTGGGGTDKGGGNGEGGPEGTASRSDGVRGEAGARGWKVGKLGDRW